jgi:hypothetical protein
MRLGSSEASERRGTLSENTDALQKGYEAFGQGDNGHDPVDLDRRLH